MQNQNEFKKELKFGKAYKHSLRNLKYATLPLKMLT